MGKRFVSVLLALCLICVGLPVGALAAESGDAEIYAENGILSADGNAAGSGNENEVEHDEPGQDQNTAAGDLENQDLNIAADIQEPDLTPEEPDEKNVLASGECGKDGNNLTWELTEDGVLMISGSGDMKDYVHRNAYNEYNPEEVPWEKYKKDVIKEVVFKSDDDSGGITRIGKDAFYSCKTLGKVEIPDSVISIGEDAFSYCGNLTSIHIPGSVDVIERYAFQNCVSLSSVVISDGVKRLQENAFSGCKNLEYVSVPESVTVFGSDVFNYCSKLQSAGAAGGGYNYEFGWTEEIPRRAFNGFRELSYVEVPDGITTIGNGAFDGCSRLQRVKLPDSIVKIGASAFGYCIYMPTINLPDSITEIGEGAFYSCTSLKRIKIPDGVTAVGTSMFRGCVELVSVDLPDSVTAIGSLAFSGCFKLADIQIPGNVTTIGSEAFFSCRSLKSVNIPDGVQAINNSTFNRCSNLVEVNLPDSVTVIGNNAFESCNKLNSLKIPEHVTKIGENVFHSCSSLTDVEIPAGITKISYALFQYCSSLANVSIPDSVTEIGDRAFWGCKSLTEIEIPGSVTIIGDQSFRDCESLTSITIPAGVTEIKRYAFSYNYNLTDVTIPESVTTLGEEVFYNCSKLVNVSLPGSLTTIGKGIFHSCSSLEAITIPEGITALAPAMFYGCSSLAGIELPESLTEIGYSVFWGCSSLSEIKIPDQVKLIGASAFRLCSSLKEVTIPDQVENLSACVFLYCSSLTKVTIPANLKTVGNDAFHGCTNLTEVQFPDSVTSISYGTFEDCEKLAEVKLPAGIRSIGEKLFSGCSSLAKVIIPVNVTVVYASAFKDCSSLESVILPEKVTEIGAYAFMNCSSLANVGMYGQIKRINSEAFSGCGSLTEIQLPDSVIYIGSNVFAGCHEEFVIYCSPGSYAETYAKTNNIPYRHLSFRTLQVSAVDGDGNPVTDGISIIWYGADGNELGNGWQLSGADSSKTYAFEICLNEELSLLYKQPERQMIRPEDESVREVRLVSKGSAAWISLSGQVLDKQEQPVSGAEVSLGYGEHGEKIVSTGMDGGFRVDVPYTYITITIRKDGYYQEDISLDLTGESERAYDIGNCVLTEVKQVSDRVALKITQRLASEEPEQGLEELLASAKSLAFSLTGSDGRSVTDFEVQGTSLLFHEGAVRADEIITIKISDPAGIYNGASTQAVLDGDRRGTASFLMVQKGSFVLSGLSGPEANMFVFDNAGKTVCTKTAEGGTNSGILEAGIYSVVFMEKSGLLDTVPNLDYLNKLELAEGKDYLQKEVVISDGTITRLEDCTVPRLDMAALSYTVEDNTFVTSNKSNGAVVGELIMIRASYEMDQKKAAQSDSLQIVFPDDVIPVEKGITLDGKYTAYTYDEGSRTVHIRTGGRDRSVVYLYCRAYTSGIKNISACLALANGAVCPVGAVTVSVEQAQLSVPKEVSYAEGVKVSGKTIPGSTVTLYDNETEAGTAVANNAGSWSIVFDLVQPVYTRSYHFIHAKIEHADWNESVLTEKAMLTYSKGNATKLKKITMYNTGDHGAQTTVFQFTGDTSASVPYYRIWPSRYPTFTFQAEFEGDASGLSDVYIVTTNSAGKKTYVKTVYDQGKKAWVGSYDYTSFSDAPAQVGIAYQDDKENEVPFDAEQFADAGLSLMEALEDSQKELEACWEKYYELEDPVLKDDNCVELKMVYKNPETGEREVFGTYSMKDMPLGDVSIEALAEDGYHRIDDEAKLWERTQYNGASVVTDYADLAEHTQFTESILLNGSASADSRRLITADGLDTAAHVIGDFIGLIPGPLGMTAGLIVETELAIIDTVKEQMLWRTEFDGDKKILEDNIKMLDKFLWVTCKADGRQRLSHEDQERFQKDIAVLNKEWEDYCEKSLRIMNAGILSSMVSYGLKLTIQNKVKKLYGNLKPSVVKIMGKDNDLEKLSTQRARKFLEQLKAGKVRAVEDVILDVVTGEAYDAITGLPIDTSNLPFMIYNSASITGYIRGNYNRINQKITGLRNKIMTSYVRCDGIEDHDDGFYDGLILSARLPMTSIMDPSGYVYEAVPSNRLSGVTAEIYEQNSENRWNAESYDQLNPQTTGLDGTYYWDVPEGKWNVCFTKDGYLPADTSQTENAEDGWLPVPPPQLELAVGMVSTAAPVVKQAAAYQDQAELVFSQYMDIASVQEAVFITSEGSSVKSEIKPLDAEDDLSGKVQYATRFAIVPESGMIADGLVIFVADTAENYAETKMQTAYLSDPLTVSVHPTGIEIPDTVTVNLNETTSVVAVLQPGLEGRELTAESLTPSVVTCGGTESVTVTTGKDGCAEIVLTGELPGSGRIRISEPVSGLTKIVTVRTEIAKSTEKEVLPVTVSLEDGTILNGESNVPVGTQIVLKTQTEGATIRYTLNDTCPCKEEAFVYSKPLEITEPVILRATAWKDGVYSATIRLQISVKQVEKPVKPGTEIDSGQQHSHSYQYSIIPALPGKNGRTVQTCTICKEEKSEIIYAPGNVRLSKTAYVYNGKNRKPSVTIKDSRGKKLKQGTDYTVSIPGKAKKVGIYTVTVKLKGNYSGTLKASFTIRPQTVKMTRLISEKKGFTVKWKKQKNQDVTYEISYSMKKKFSKKSTYTIKAGKKSTSKKIKNLKAGKRYYVRIRSYQIVKSEKKSKKLYSAWSKIKSVTTKK